MNGILEDTVERSVVRGITLRGPDMDFIPAALWHTVFTDETDTPQSRGLKMEKISNIQGYLVRATEVNCPEGCYRVTWSEQNNTVPLA